MPQKPSASSPLPTLGLLALAGGLGVIFNFVGRWRNLPVAVPQFIALMLAAGALYVTGVYLVERFILGPSALLVIVLGALFFRLCLLPRDPALSNDVYRYQWEGRVERLHINPYAVNPAMLSLSALEESRHPIETGRNVSTLYPPLSEISFSWVSTIGGYKVLYTGFDLAALGVLAALLVVLKQPLQRLLTYAWNPCILISFAMCGHHDSLAIFTLLAAILFLLLRRPALSVSFLALSAISKFFPALLLPIILKRTRAAYAALFIAIAGLSYLPFLSAGSRLFKGLSDYATGWENNDSLFRLIRFAGNSKSQAELVAGVLVLIVVAVTLRLHLEPLGASLLLISSLLFLSPNAFPWYFTWIVPFLCFYPRAPLLLITISSFLGYAPVVAYAAGQPYRDSNFILLLEYAPVLALLLYQGCRVLRPAS